MICGKIRGREQTRVRKEQKLEDVEEEMIIQHTQIME